MARAAAIVGGVRQVQPDTGEHDRLLRWDMSAGHSQAGDTDASIGEVVFVPRDRRALQHGCNEGQPVT